MPELPEVEHMKRQLAGWCDGKELWSLIIEDGLIVKSEEDPPRKGWGPVRVGRRAKYIYLVGEHGALLFHMRMSGKLVEGTKGERIRVRFVFDDDEQALLDDQRRLAELRYFAEEDAMHEWLEQRDLGPEPWPLRRGALWWSEQYAGARAPIKPALMNQKRIAGLGNIAASEACWRARINPRVRVDEMEAEQWGDIEVAVHGHINSTLAALANKPMVFVQDKDPNRPNPFNVYAKLGEPCPRCDTEIARFAQSSRATYWCPACQGDDG